jgi:amidase
MWNDATEEARLMRNGEVSAVELVDAAISRLQVPPELNVLVHADFGAARAAEVGRREGGAYRFVAVSVPWLRRVGNRAVRPAER